MCSPITKLGGEQDGFMNKTVLCVSRSGTCLGHHCALTYISEGTIRAKIKKENRKKKNAICATQAPSVHLGCGPEKHLGVCKCFSEQQCVVSLLRAGQQGLALEFQSQGAPAPQHPQEMLSKVTPLGPS